MPHRPPKKSKRALAQSAAPDRVGQRESQRLQEMATRSTLARFQNRKSEKK